MSLTLRRLAVAALSVAPLTAGLLGSATPAQAATPSGCPSAYLCVWRLRDYADLRGQWATSISNLSSYPRPGCAQSTWNDCAQSVYNLTSHTVGLYVDANYNGNPGYYEDTIGPGGYANLSSTLASKLSSFYLG